MASVAKPSASPANSSIPPGAKPLKSRVPWLLRLLRFGFQFIGRVSPVAAGRFACFLWFKPTRFKIPVTERNFSKSAVIERVDIGSHNIATYVWGKSGPAVLLVHGWSGRGSQLGAFAKPLVKVGYQVIAFDAPAHGMSSGNQTNIYEIADVIVGLQDYYGPFDSVITHSFGGPVTTLAIKHGLNTNRMVCIAPPAAARKLVENFLRVLRIPEKAGQNMVRRLEARFGAQIWDEVSMINTIRDVAIPGLLIHDSGDKDVPWQEGKTVADAWRYARFVKTSGLGHRRILRDRTVIDTAVRFIETA